VTEAGNISTGFELNERAQNLLKILVERYIHDGQPVGSRTLSRDTGLDLSPATIRNVMADLEELGFLRAPHTSAGRVPTVRGYRFFVDSLLRVQTLDNQAIDELKRQLDASKDTTELMQSVSTMLSNFTRLAGVVMLPRRNVLTMRHVEFLLLSENRVLVILVVNEQEVQNRIIHTQRNYKQSELQQAANFLNEHFAGHDIQQVRKEVLRQMEADRASMNDMMTTVIEMADKVFEPDEKAPGDDYVLDGETNLMGVAELSDMDKLRQLFEAFNQKRDLLHLLDQCINTQGVQILIGEESGFGVLDECSVVTAPYSIDNRVLGVLGVIGPTRMAYDRVIPIVDITAKLLASVLNSRN
jgi:heat-inducible transcriptional repressor